VIAYGTVEELIDPGSRTNAIKQIMLHYSDKDWEISDKELSRTKLWRVKLDEITGKKSPVDNE
jgi:nitroimidazol reductase NimA-like FMN-containing flavoprotein (pyridoxamine 5'-phosphate oxidase superfamily)